MQLDQVLRLTTRAIQVVVDPFGGAAFEIGDDEADIEAERRGFDTRDGASDCADVAGVHSARQKHPKIAGARSVSRVHHSKAHLIGSSSVGTWPQPRLGRLDAYKSSPAGSGSVGPKQDSIEVI